MIANATWLRPLLTGCICLIFLMNTRDAAAQTGMRVVDSFRIASNGWWDYICPDPASERLYVSHGTQVNILNKNTGDSLGIIQGTAGVHGIALVPGLGKGFISNGRLNNVFVFDEKTGQVLDSVATGKNPDAIFYESYTRSILTCNGGSADLSVINPATLQRVATVPLAGKPETAVSDGKGKLYVNIEDKNAIQVVNLRTLRVEATWSLAPAEGPTGLSIDTLQHLLFAGCDGLLLVVDARTGKIKERITIPDGCDGTAFDPGTRRVYASCGAGYLSVLAEDGTGHFKLQENIPTAPGARTLGLDVATHVLYLPTANFAAAPAGQRPPMVAGTLRVLVVK